MKRILPRVGWPAVLGSKGLPSGVWRSIFGFHAAFPVLRSITADLAAALERRVRDAK